MASKKYYSEHKEKIAAYGAKYYADHREKAADRGAKYYVEHKEESAARSVKRYAEHKKEILAYQRKYKLIKKYGLTIMAYDEMSATQKGVCAICGHPPSGHGRNGKKLMVDHDHSTGKLRGLLCGNCNKMLGFANDLVEILDNAISYLQSTS